MERVIVCVKPVPDPQAWDRLRMDPVTKTLIREGIPSVINPLDKHALEAALEIKDSFGAKWCSSPWPPRTPDRSCGKP
jgi:electron transfer flavoprotein beta subunit